MIYWILNIKYKDVECSLVEEEECRTITEELCEEAQYLTVLDSYGNEVGTGTSGQNIDSYGAPLAPPLKEEGEPRPPDSLYICTYTSSITITSENVWTFLQSRL